jgi:hypothetical protein
MVHVTGLFLTFFCSYESGRVTASLRMSGDVKPFTVTLKTPTRRGGTVQLLIVSVRVDPWHVGTIVAAPARRTESCLVRPSAIRVGIRYLAPDGHQPTCDEESRRPVHEER